MIHHVPYYADDSVTIVWYGQGRIVEPFSRAHCGWRRHSCKGPRASRAYWATAIRETPDEMRIRHREWMRRKRAA